MTKGLRLYNGGRSLFNKSAGKTGELHAKERGSLSYPSTKINFNSKWITDLNITSEILKLLEEVSSLTSILAKNFLNPTRKVTKAKIVGLAQMQRLLHINGNHQ